MKVGPRIEGEWPHPPSVWSGTTSRTSLDDGRTVEVGIIGCEGIVGINILLDGRVTPDKAIVQLPRRCDEDEVQPVCSLLRSQFYDAGEVV